MWRSVIVYEGEKITVEKGFLVVIKDSDKNKIPIDDISCVVIDNAYLSITTQSLSRLSQNNIPVIITDNSHLPKTIVMPLNGNYHCFKIIKDQMSLNKLSKDIMWKTIIKFKIRNQAVVLKNNSGKDEIVDRLLELSKEVEIGDVGNREGIAAKMFFRNMYGSDFIRFNDDSINAALDFGYSIIRSFMAVSLASCGFNLCLGIHHISETNAFNLADDFMEPFRALVDNYVNMNHSLITLPLSKDVKSGLVNILNESIISDGKITKVRYAIYEMAKSYITVIKSGCFEELKVPEVICLKEE